MTATAAAVRHDDPARWTARLDLGFARTARGTTLVRRQHDGPLVVQKALHPEGPDVCQVVLVHPPAGIAAHDDLRVSLDVGSRAHAQVTTPGATRWYRSAGGAATQRVRAAVAQGGALEWLPQGNIVFDGARASSHLRFELAAGASLLAWEWTCLGRHAAGERFTVGRFRQRLEVVRDGALAWCEALDLAGGSALLASPVGLAGLPVFGTLVAAGPRLDEHALAAVRALAPAAGEAAATLVGGVLVARWRGPASDAVLDHFNAAWRVLRPVLLGRVATAPRIWST